METDIKRDIVAVLLSKGFLLDRTMLDQINRMQDHNSFHSFLLEQFNKGTVLTGVQDIFQKYTENNNLIPQEIKPLEQIPDPAVIPANVKITFSYEEEPKKREVKDFTQFFTSRYHAIKQILQSRKELNSPTSINRLSQKKQREQVALIGIITNKQITKTGKVIFTLEDPTGTIKVLISDRTPQMLEIAMDSVPDEIIGITGTASETIVFANKIILPDVPIYKEIKKSPDEAYAVFIGDLHFGSNVFLKEPFEKFLGWIRGEQGNEEQKNISKKIRYLFLVGDLVEGVGIYPNQEKDLEIKDIYEQYNELSKYLQKIPNYIQIIICPGNHDAMRIAEPQPPLYKDFAEGIWNLPNVTMVSNPAYINIHSSEEFPGFDVLMYHGFSFIHYADVVESIRSKGGQERVDLIMKFLLQRRHLAPTHTSTLYLPDAKKDSLVIDKIPDFFISGHIHRVSASSYRNVTLFNCSCWLETTEYQEKVGLHPQPGRAILTNLQTRKVKILKFYDEAKD